MKYVVIEVVWVDFREKRFPGFFFLDESLAKVFDWIQVVSIIQWEAWEQKLDPLVVEEDELLGLGLERSHPNLLLGVFYLELSNRSPL